VTRLDDALASDDRETILAAKDVLAALNERDCPLAGESRKPTAGRSHFRPAVFPWLNGIHG
jgi:hypothetical protein